MEHLRWTSRIRFVVLLASFIWLGWLRQSYSQNPLFVPAPTSPITVGPGSGQVFLADINRDGHLDLLTKHLLNRTVAIQLGDGTGHFTPAAKSPMRFSYEPGTTALGDLNNDNILDLGVTNRDDAKEKVNIFLGNGTGGFSRATGSPFSSSLSIEVYKPSLRFIDVNEDKNLDIVTANGRRNTLEILFGDGQGGFSPGPVVRLEPGQDYYSFALGDIDGDGHLDLVAASSNESNSEPSRIVTKRGDGKGDFKDPFGPPLSVPAGPRVGMLADINGDQHLDVVLNHSDSTLLSVLLNQGNGIFIPAPGSPLNLGTQAFAVVIADANRDEKADILAATVNTAATTFPSKIMVLLGDTQGFEPAPGSPFPAGPGAYNLTVGDVNEDGKLDIAATSFEGESVTLLLGQ